MIFLPKTFAKGLIFILVSLLLSCGNSGRNDFFREADFNSDWKYRIGDIDDGARPDLDDSEWKPVHLPHDWSIEDYELQDSLHQGPFYKRPARWERCGLPERRGGLVQKGVIKHLQI